MILLMIYLILRVVHKTNIGSNEPPTFLILDERMETLFSTRKTGKASTRFSLLGPFDDFETEDHIPNQERPFRFDLPDVPV